MPKVLRNYFHLNYGGPGLPNANTVEDGGLLLDLCRERYCQNQCKDWVGEKRFEVKGVIVTVYTHGIHRSLSLSLPPNPSQETLDAFEKARRAAIKFCDKDYWLLANNCASAVAHTLRSLDENITSTKVLPWELDKAIDKYMAAQPTESIAPTTASEKQREQNVQEFQKLTQDFQNKYKEIAEKESFSSFKRGQKYWDDKTIRSTSEILDRAYYKTGPDGERTKTALIDLKWVVEDEKGFLRPTKEAPEVFSDGLRQYNASYEKVLKLKEFYKEHAGKASLHTTDIFKDNPNYGTAMDRLKMKATIDPKGTAAKVLKSLDQEKPDFSRANFKELQEKQTEAQSNNSISMPKP